jgi:hypothetical protein
MSCTTTCPTCGRRYEVRSEEEANSLSRQCQRCHEEAARTTPMRPLEIIDYMTPLTFPADAISMDSPPIQRTMKKLSELAKRLDLGRMRSFERSFERASLIVNGFPPPSRTPLLDGLDLPAELRSQLLRSASPEMLEHMIRQYHQPLAGESLKAALDYLNSIQGDDVTNTERTTKTISRNGALCDETPTDAATDSHVVAQLEGIRLALCEIALNTAAIADHLAGSK